jgi:hypothetical protein
MVFVDDLAEAFHRMGVDLEAPCCMVLVPPVAHDTDEVRGSNDSEVEDVGLDIGKAWGAGNSAVVSELVVAAADAGNIADAVADILAYYDRVVVAVSVNEMDVAAYSLLLEIPKESAGC